MNRSCTNVCPVKIDIHEQIYVWREVMEDRDQIKIVKKEAMIVVGKVLSSPKLYRIAMSSTETALTILPDVAIYNPLNYWGKHRDVPDAADKTFHEWYKSHRLKANEALGL